MESVLQRLSNWPVWVCVRVQILLERALMGIAAVKSEDRGVAVAAVAVVG